LKSAVLLRSVYITLLLCLTACATTPPRFEAPAAKTQLDVKQIYVVPFETVMVPRAVSADLFDLFVDRLNEKSVDAGIEFVILKQGTATIPADWLADKTYLRGELFAYIEEVGSSMTEIKARSRIRLYLPGSGVPALQLTVPTEIFYQNDYSSLAIERRKLAEQVADKLVTQFLASIQAQ
jgi:hypothetical protein